MVTGKNFKKWGESLGTVASFPHVSEGGTEQQGEPETNQLAQGF